MARIDYDTAELRARGNWHELKGKIKKNYGVLTDDDLEYDEGKEEEWYGRIAKKVGRTVDDVKGWIRGLVD
jgi:uncharacterized protein YjbJ (UPF0337 family)